MDTLDTKQQFEALIKEVRSAGEIARTYFTSSDSTNEQKGDGSVVTQVDKDVQERLMQYIRNHFPDDGIVGEEDGDDIEGSSSHVWWIDPIDGTDNFLRRIPYFAISVARLGESAEDSFGIVYNPVTDQLFASYMDNDVYENTHVHRVNNELLGGRAIISIGRGKEQWMKSADYNVRKAVGERFGKGAAYGCCALELAYVAANRIDGILIMGLSPWDYAAGVYLVKSAGGRVSCFEEGEWKEWKGSAKELCVTKKKYLFASHDGLHDEALALIGDPKKWAD